MSVYHLLTSIRDWLEPSLATLPLPLRERGRGPEGIFHGAAGRVPAGGLPGSEAAASVIQNPAAVFAAGAPEASSSGPGASQGGTPNDEDGGGPAHTSPVQSSVPAATLTPAAPSATERPAIPLTPATFRNPIRPARIFIGSMPATAREAVSAAPFVVIQALGGHDIDGMHQVEIAIRVCVVGGDADDGAEEDLHNLISCIRLRMLAIPGGLLAGGRFRHVMSAETGDMTWERPDEQVPPFLQAHIFSSWQQQGVAHVAV